MDGKDLLRRLRNLLNEDSDSGWLDPQTSYDLFYDAAIEFVDRTGCLRSSQTITTVAEQSEYNLMPDFLRLYTKNKSGNYYIKYSDGSSTSFPTWKDYEDIFYENNTNSVTTPGKFTIIDAPLLSKKAGLAKGISALSILADADADFSNVEAGASVHNVTDGSSGIVLSKTNVHTLVTALFGGTNNTWTGLVDYYIIQPNPRLQLILDPPPSIASHTMAVPYVQRPSPVYSDYGTYRFVNPSVLVKYVFWLYKYRDREPNFGDAMYKFWELEIGRKAYSTNRAQRPKGFAVNLKKRD